MIINDMDRQLLHCLANTTMGRNDPKARSAYLMAMITGVTIVIPDDIWEDMASAAPMPCGEVDCDCHDSSGPLFAQLDKMRTAQKGKFTAERKAKG